MADAQRSNCPFCLLIDDPGAITIHRDDYVIAFPGLRQPADRRAQFVVAPRLHVRTLAGLPPNLYGPLLRAVSTVSAAVDTAFASASVVTLDPLTRPHVQHVHFTVTPRLDKDRPEWELRSVEEEERAEQAELVRMALPR